MSQHPNEEICAVDDAPSMRTLLEVLEKTRAQMRQSEKLASIGHLAAGVAHEINNPTGFISMNLGTLQGYQRDMAELLSRYRALLDRVLASSAFSRLEPDIKVAFNELKKFEKEIDIEYLLSDSADLVNDCREGAMRIKKIVMDLKAFVHPGDDQMQSMDINEGLETTLNLVHNQLKYKAVVKKELGPIPKIRGCPQQLNQVFMNILVNAAQAIEKRGTINVLTRYSKGQVEVEISDDGCGISQAHLSKLYDPFFTTKAVGKGTGMGMHIARDIIEKHRGVIEVRSEPGKGATFLVRLPAEKDAPGNEAGLAPEVQG